MSKDSGSLFEYQLKIATEIILILLISFFFSFVSTYFLILTFESKNTRHLYGSRIEAQDDLIILERLEILRPIIIKYLLLNVFVCILLFSALVYLRISTWAELLKELE